MAGLMTIGGALCCAELAAMLPRAGGQYVFLRQAYGPSIGFLFGWTLFLVIQTGTIAAVAIAFAKFAGVFVPAIGNEHYLIKPIHLFGVYAISLSTEQLVAVLLIFLLTWVNTGGLAIGKMVQNTFTIAKTAALLGLLVAGLSLGWKATCAARSSAWWNPWANGWTSELAQPGLTIVGGLALALIFGKAMVGPLFAQTAWTNVTFTGSEIRDPGRTLPRALLIGCGAVVILYVLTNLAYVATLSLGEIAHAPQNRVGVASMSRLFGGPGASAMAAAILISTFGANNGLILAGARVYYAMARDGLFFRSIARVNAQHAPSAGTRGAGRLGSATNAAAHGRGGSERRGSVRQCLHATARVYCRRRSGFLYSSRGGRHRAAPKETRRDSSVSRLGLSACPNRSNCSGRALDRRSGDFGPGNLRYRMRHRIERFTGVFPLETPA
jgi:APA family basic amino acid/polyamine antiporter